MALRAVAGACLIPWLCLPGFAQPSPSSPAFEVASIKRAQPGRVAIGMRSDPGGRFTGTNVTLKLLITRAYNVRDVQISGGPTWFDTERYDISAKAEHDVTNDERTLMIRTMLADRFKLALHRDTKGLPIYVLVIAKNGPKLQELKDEGSGPAASSGGRGQLSMQRTSMAMFASALSSRLGRLVQDRTGMSGIFDLKLEWTPDDSRTQFGSNGRDSDSAGPSIFTALSEQLGLKLESTKGAVEVLIIDHAEKPSEN
jgi:uncharacterized protein (TIGR03435 family)